MKRSVVMHSVVPFGLFAMLFSSAALAQAPMPVAGRWYRLQTVFRGAGECLEGNQSSSPVHGGAAFMDRCQNVSGQLWRLVPEGNGFRLRTQFRGDGENSGEAVVFSILFGIIFLFMSLPAINLININLNRIMERSSEIGIRKAFGASSKTLTYQFITENIMLSLIIVRE